MMNTQTLLQLITQLWKKDENDPTEYVQIRTDNPEYVKLLVENGLIEERPDFIMTQGYIGIMFFAPTEEFANYIKKNVKL